MKPLLIMVCFGRSAETRKTLESLIETGAVEQSELVIWDNGSTDNTLAVLNDFWDQVRDGQIIFSPGNVGCPAALNRAMHDYRKPGQHVIKIDNDVRMLTPGWVDLLCRFLADHQDVGMASAWYAELENVNHGRKRADLGDWEQHFPIVGHCTIHRGRFLDQTGYFDVLAPDHLYGFEDTLMCHRAAVAGYKCAVVKGVRLENLQRWSSMDVAHDGDPGTEKAVDHVNRLRPLYKERAVQIHTASRYYVDETGAVAPRSDE